jgi:hypothetical protein
MTSAGRRPAPRRRGRRLATFVLLAVTGAALFALGIGLGKALEENPKPGGSLTQVRTLRPLPLAPARQTVTVTVTVTTG